MLELLLISACLQGPGCSQASTAYYESSPAMKEQVAILKRTYSDVVEPALLLAPFVEGRAKVDLGPIDLHVERQKAALLFNYEF